MKDNKLKHSFVEKDEATETFLNEWLRLTTPQVQPFTIEQSFRNYEDVVVSETILDQLLERNNDDYVEYLKKELSHRLAKILLEEGFIDFSVHKNIYTDYTNFRMRIKAIRNSENNVR
jgi:hypothetical protein